MIFTSAVKAEYQVTQLRSKNGHLIFAAKAKYDFSRSTADRIIKFSNTNKAALNKKELEEAISKAKIAEFELLNSNVNQDIAKIEPKRAKALLKQRTVRSPVDGIALERTMSPGEYVTTKQVY